MNTPERMPPAQPREPWPAPYAIDPALPAALPRDGRPAIVTVGTFDGVHRGHWEVLEEIGRRARRTGGRSILVTFHPHPLRIVRPGGSILVDNAFAFGQLFEEAPTDREVGAVRKFNDLMAAESGLHGIIVPIGDGLWVAVVEGRNARGAGR